MIDLHQKFDCHEAVEICRLMEPSRPFCVEDPVREEQFRTQIPKLRLLTTVPLAPGEDDRLQRQPLSLSVRPEQTNRQRPVLGRHRRGCATGHAQRAFGYRVQLVVRFSGSPGKTRLQDSNCLRFQSRRLSPI
jgi:hypothetical protein